MRIATYNIWNSDTNWSDRLAALTEELLVLDADVVALQEARTQASSDTGLDEYLRSETGYRHVLHLPYPPQPDDDERPEGLAFLSKLPIEGHRPYWEIAADTANNWAARITIRWRAGTVSVTNVHLDWKSEEGREQHIVPIVRGLIDADPAECDLLCGDFNCDLESTVARFLGGHATIDGEGTRWRDAAEEHFCARGEVASPTLDFETNPAWLSANSLQHPVRFDRIYVRSAESAAPPPVERCGLIGKEPANKRLISPSDHYGVFIDLAL